MDLKMLIEDYFRFPTSRNAFQIIASISNGLLRLEDLAYSLQPYLLSNIIDFRLNGLNLLSDLIHYLWAKLSVGEVFVFSEFYISKIKDRFVLMEQVLSGMMHLIRIRTVREENVIGLVREMFSRLQIASLTQRARFYAQSIIQHTLVLHNSAAVKMGSDFVYGFIQAIDGEIDPRNLMIALQSVPLITMYLPITLLLGELFEVIWCYFPVDIEVTPEIDITRSELAVVLSTALSSSPLFSDSLLPLLLEKMNSEILTAKRDSIELFNIIIPIYGCVKLKCYTESIWYAIKNLIFLTKFRELDQKGLKAISQLVHAFSNWNSEETYKLVDHIIHDTKHHLLDSDDKLVNSSIEILIAASCKPSTFSQIGSIVLPILCEKAKYDYNPIVLQSLSNFVSILVTRFAISDIELKVVNLVKNSLFSSTISKFKLQQQCADRCYLFKLLNSMLCVPSCLSENEVETIVSIYLETLLISREIEDCDLQNGMLDYIAKTSFRSIQDMLIIRGRKIIAEQHNKRQIYTILTVICSNLNIAEEIIPMSIEIAIDNGVNSLKLCVEFLMNVWKKCEQKFYEKLYSQSVLCPLFRNFTGGKCSKFILSLFRLVFVELSMDLKTQWIDILFKEYVQGKLLSEMSYTENFRIFSVILGASPLHLYESFVSSILDISFKFVKIDSECSLYGAQMFSCLVNKLSESAIFKEIARLEPLYSFVIEQQNPRFLKSYGIMLKGIIICSHPGYLNKSLEILSLFPSSTLGDHAVEVFSDLLRDEEFFTFKVLSNINIFYKQRFYSSHIEHILHGFANSEGDIRQRFLAIIVFFMQTIPLQVIKLN